MSRKRSCIETDDGYFIATERQKLTDICVSICASIAALEKAITSLDQRIREQRYAIEGLQREVSDLQSHAIHGAFAMDQDQCEVSHVGPYRYVNPYSST